MESWHPDIIFIHYFLKQINFESEHLISKCFLDHCWIHEYIHCRFSFLIWNDFHFGFFLKNSVRWFHCYHCHWVKNRNYSNKFDGLNFFFWVVKTILLYYLQSMETVFAFEHLYLISSLFRLDWYLFFLWLIFIDWGSLKYFKKRYADL